MPWARRSLHAPRPSSPRSMWPDTCTVGSARGDMHRRLLPCSKPMRGHRSVGRRYSLYRAGSRAAGECVCCLVSRARTVITVQRTAVHVHNIKQKQKIPPLGTDTQTGPSRGHPSSQRIGVCRRPRTRVATSGKTESDETRRRPHVLPPPRNTNATRPPTPSRTPV